MSARLTTTALQLQQIAAQSPAPTSTILVAATASLQKAFQEVTAIYTKANPNQTVNYNFAASGVLEQQIALCDLLVYLLRLLISKLIPCTKGFWYWELRKLY